MPWKHSSVEKIREGSSSGFALASTGVKNWVLEYVVESKVTQDWPAVVAVKWQSALGQQLASWLWFVHVFVAIHPLFPFPNSFHPKSHPIKSQWRSVDGGQTGPTRTTGRAMTYKLCCDRRGVQSGKNSKSCKGTRDTRETFHISCWHTAWPFCGLELKAKVLLPMVIVLMRNFICSALFCAAIKKIK